MCKQCSCICKFYFNMHVCVNTFAYSIAKSYRNCFDISYIQCEYEKICFENRILKKMEAKKSVHDTLRKLEVEVIKKNSKISELQSELQKANEVTNQMKALLRSQLKFIDVSAKQQMIMLQQHETIKKYKKQIVRLRIKNRQKHMTGPIKEDAKKDEKAKYSKEDMVQALMAVSKGSSLGKASKQFSVPKESLRQAKLRADQANATKKE